MSDTSPLAAHGVIRLFGPITQDSVQPVIERIIAANLEPEHPFLRLWIGSPGGDTMHGFALLDIMRWSRVPIRTTGIGLVGSMALLVLMAGAKGQRSVLPRSMLLSHRFSTMTAGTHADLIAARVMEDRLHARIVEHYTACTGFEAAAAERELLRPTDRWLDPAEAVALGVIDRVWEPGCHDDHQEETR